MKSFKSYLKEYGGGTPAFAVGGASTGPGMGQYVPTVDLNLRAQKKKNPRRLTPKEAKYLMGFCDKYAKFFGHKDGFPQVVSDAQSYKQFGNSVVPLVVEKIAKEILKKL